jgi:hypothetical protein
MKTLVRNILITGSLAIFASSSMVAQTSNGGFEQWYRAKYGRPSPTEQARLNTQRANAASPEATRPPIAVSTSAGFEQWYRAKYGRSSPTEEARLEAQQVNPGSPEATPPTVTASADNGFEQRYQAKYGHPSPTSEASLGQIPAKEHLSKHQLNTLIATAKTPAEHQRIAQFYQSQAQDYLAQSKEHALEAEQSRNNPLRNNNKAVFSTVNHCEHYAQKFSDLAATSQELAKQHEQMASNAGKPSALQASSHFPTSESLGK